MPSSGSLRRAVAACAMLLAPATASAQCPDGRVAATCARPATLRPVSPPPVASRRRSFLVLPFRNVSRGAEQEWMVEGATAMIGESLDRWEEITVVPDDRLYPALRRQGIVAGGVADPRFVRRVAEETGGWTAVSGNIVATGGRVQVTARAYDVVTNGDVVLARAEGPAGADARLLFRQVAAQLLRSAGLDTTAGAAATVTTSSLEAYRAYMTGMRHINRAQFRQARSALFEAVRLDSTFAQAHFMLAEAALFADPFMAFDADGVLQRSLARSVSLADHFARADREILLAVASIFNGSIVAARGTLERLVARDSSDLRAIAWLSFVEYVDIVLVGPPGQERPRGSMNANLRLAKRLLEVDPARHDAYLPVVGNYLLAAGGFPQVRPGVRREPSGLEQMISGAPARLFVPLLRDSVVLVPAESLSSIPPDTLVAARRRALDAARAISARWLAEGPTEAVAHYAAAEVAALERDNEATLRHVDRAEALGLEFGGSDTRLIRMNALARLGRYDEARRRANAENIWPKFQLDLGIIAWLESGEATLWAFNLCLMWGEYGRVGEMLDRRTAGIMSVVPSRAMAEGAAIQILAGEPFPPFWLTQLPLRFRMDVLDSLWARTPPGSGGTRLESVRPTLARLLSRSATAAGADSATAARARRSPWFVP